MLVKLGGVLAAVSFQAAFAEVMDVNSLTRKAHHNTVMGHHVEEANNGLHHALMGHHATTKSQGVSAESTHSENHKHLMHKRAHAVEAASEQPKHLMHTRVHVAALQSEEAPAAAPILEKRRLMVIEEEETEADTEATNNKHWMRNRRQKATKVEAVAEAPNHRLVDTESPNKHWMRNRNQKATKAAASISNIETPRRHLMSAAEHHEAKTENKQPQSHLMSAEHHEAAKTENKQQPQGHLMSAEHHEAARTADNKQAQSHLMRTKAHSVVSAEVNEEAAQQKTHWMRNRATKASNLGVDSEPALLGLDF